MIQFDPDGQRLRLSVGDLVARSADTTIRSAPGWQARALVGAREHGAWRAELEGAGDTGDFAAEVPLEYWTRILDHEVLVEGRADGLQLRGGRWIVHEVKSVILEPTVVDERELREAVLAGTAFAAYRLQLEIYVLMVATSPPVELFGGDVAGGEAALPVAGEIVLRNLAADRSGDRELTVEICPEIEEVRRGVHELLESVLENCLERHEERRRRAELAPELPFAFATYRQGQEGVVDAVGGAFEAGESLLLCAPPGIGKTAAALHAALRFALPRGRRVFWVTAKTTQQRLVAETLARVHERLESGSCGGALAFRALVLRAREKICPNLRDGGEVFCHDAYCRYARDHSRKLRENQITSALLRSPLLEPDRIYEEAVSVEACPFELSMELVLEADVVVGDYNYIFDPRSALRRHDLERLCRGAVLVVDEAHNLPVRGREIFSPGLDRGLLDGVLEESAWRAASQDEDLHETAHRCLELFADSEAEAGPTTEAGVVPVDLDLELLEELGASFEEVQMRRLLDGTARGVPGRRDPLEAFLLDLRRVLATIGLAREGLPVATLLDRSQGPSRLRLLCLDPSCALGRTLRSFHAVLGMSATLEPLEFFRDMLGLPPERTRLESMRSPFPRRHRAVLVDPRFATTYRRRGRDARRVAETIEAIAGLRPGNYLAFFSSHAYLREVLSHVDPRKVGGDVIAQTPRMSESARDEVLERLREPGSTRILFAVQGGIFGEGVDYAGDMARGIIVVGPGLPRLGPETELVRAHFQELYEKGFEYAYLYPGMHRVIQSAGRLIRGPDDVGIVVLLGERFATRPYLALFPPDWYERDPVELLTRDLLGDLRAFWDGQRQDSPVTD